MRRSSTPLPWLLLLLLLLLQELCPRQGLQPSQVARQRHLPSLQRLRPSLQLARSGSLQQQQLPCLSRTVLRGTVLTSLTALQQVAIFWAAQLWWLVYETRESPSHGMAGPDHTARMACRSTTGLGSEGGAEALGCHRSCRMLTATRSWRCGMPSIALTRPAACRATSNLASCQDPAQPAAPLPASAPRVQGQLCSSAAGTCLLSCATSSCQLSLRPVLPALTLCRSQPGGHTFSRLQRRPCRRDRHLPALRRLQRAAAPRRQPAEPAQLLPGQAGSASSSWREACSRGRVSEHVHADVPGPAQPCRGG